MAAVAASDWPLLLVASTNIDIQPRMRTLTHSHTSAYTRSDTNMEVRTCERHESKASMYTCRMWHAGIDVHVRVKHARSSAHRDRHKNARAPRDTASREAETRVHTCVCV